MNEESDPDRLRALQEDIFRRKVLRARSMTPTQRLDEALELTQSTFDWMHSGAMNQCGLNDAAEGWQEVRRRLARLRRLHEHNLSRTAPAN